MIVIIDPFAIGPMFLALTPAWTPAPAANGCNGARYSLRTDFAWSLPPLGRRAGVSSGSPCRLSGGGVGAAAFLTALDMCSIAGPNAAKAMPKRLMTPTIRRCFPWPFPFDRRSRLYRVGDSC